MSSENAELRKVGLKVTLPRVKIFNILENAEEHHLSAEDVYKKLLDQGDDVGLATVYRVLTQFEAAGLVLRHNFEGGHAVFEMAGDDHHDHMVCTQTGEVVEFVDEVIEERQQNGAPANIETVLGSVTDPNLPRAGVDLILLVDAYHEFSHPFEMGTAMVDALRPGGKLILIEYRAEDPAVPIKPLHKMSERQAVEEMRAIGLSHLRTEDFLPQQHFMVFEKP